MSAREDARAGVRLLAESIERGLNAIGKDETQMTVTRQDVEDLREVLEENERLKEPTCQFAGPGRGDCEHFVGYSPVLPTDDYGKPEEWCWWCWRARELEQLKADVGFQRDAADKFAKDRKEAEAKIEAVLALHRRTTLYKQIYTEQETFDGCGVCVAVWPCPTFKALRGEEEK